MEKFDKTKTHGISCPPTEDGGAWIQNEILYTHDGVPIRSVAPNATAAIVAAAKATRATPDRKKTVVKEVVENAISKPTPDGRPELGVFDLDQKWFALQKEVEVRFGVKPPTKVVALAMIETAGLSP